MANGIGETVDFVRKGDFSQTNEGQLRSTIRSLRNWQDPEAQSLIDALENEIARRHQADLQGNANALFETHHGETMRELGELKKSVHQLARARCVDKWILIAGWIAAVAAVAGVALAFFLKR